MPASVLLSNYGPYSLGTLFHVQQDIHWVAQPVTDGALRLALDAIHISKADTVELFAAHYSCYDSMFRLYFRVLRGCSDNGGNDASHYVPFSCYGTDDAEGLRQFHSFFTAV